MSVPLYLIPPPNLGDADLHITTYNTVAMWQATSDQIDSYMADAAANEAVAATGASVQAAQTQNITAAVIAVGNASAGLQTDNFLPGAAAVQANEPGNSTIVGQAATALASANQPLTNLQNDAPPPTTLPTTLAEYEAAIPSWSTMSSQAQQAAVMAWESQHPGT